MKRKGLVMSGRWIAVILMFAAVLLLQIATTADAAPAAKTLRIGSMAAMTGWYSFEGLDIMDATNMAKIINDKGGITIKGQKYNIELVPEDTKSNLEGATAAANKLAYDKKVKFVLGPAGFFGVAVAPIFNPNKILYALSFSTMQPGEIDATTPYSFLIHMSSFGACSSAGKAVKKEFPNVRKLAIVTTDDGSVPYLEPVMRKILASQEYTVLDVITYSADTQDCSPIAAKLNAIKEADAVFHMNGAPTHVGNIIKGLRESGNNKPYVFTGGIMDGADLVRIAGESAATNVLTQPLVPNSPGNPPLLDQLYAMRTGPKAPYMGNQANGLLMLVNAMKAADSIEPDAVKAKWEKMDAVETLWGKGKMGGDKTYGVHQAVGHPCSYITIMNGKQSFRGWSDINVIP